MHRASHLLSALVACLALEVMSSGAVDQVDWVNVDYVTKAQSAGGKTTSNTMEAQKSIMSKAGGMAKDGPWTIATKGIKPPSGDVRDYLSWAPYHWPNCNWCSKGTTHWANHNNTSDEPEGDSWADDSDQPSDPPLENGGVDDPETKSNWTRKINLAYTFEEDRLGAHQRMRREKRHAFIRRREISSSTATIPTEAAAPAVSTGIPGLEVPLPGSTTTSDRVVGTVPPAQAPAKTHKPSCTPSPTKSIAPSATWTTCPYVVRDGKVNPDTDTLAGPDAVQHMSQAVLYNALAYAIQKSRSNAQSVSTFIDTFFLSSTTGMHPHVNFGQQVRGPGKEHQMGTFTGILDMRGIVKIANALQFIRVVTSPDWTPARERAMTSWMNDYLSWLQTSNIGKTTASKANNHLSFYVAQLAAIKIYVGDTKGAADVLQQYFANQFQDQIARSGEQPFESVRTRPFHYRCFNLEAMITNAKLGDQLGLNLWTTKSKYGATIQSALDYTMSVAPQKEDVSEVFPHVAAVAAAYGDPKGKYAGFLQKHAGDYKSQPFWFYDQTGALPNSPASSKQKRSMGDDTIPAVVASNFDTAFNDSLEDATSPATSMAAGTTSAPFECPAVFKDALKVEIEDGLYVTCDQLRPFYELPIPVDESI